MKKSLVIIHLLLSYVSLGQELFSEIRPQAASDLSKHISNDIDNFTGVPKINIPLKSINIDGYNVNISLNYNSDGIKVDQQSSNVGLGWNLQSGGVISRVMRGFHDERSRKDIYADGSALFDKYGWLRGNGINNINLYDWDNNSNITNGYQNTYSPFFIIHPDDYGNPYYNLEQIQDTEPDIFEFSFNGKSGKFIFDNKDGLITIHQVPWMGLKIEYTMGTDPLSPSEPSIASFTITDTDNTKYIFNSSSHYIYYFYTSGIADIGNTRKPIGNMLGDAYNTSWYLTKVITPKKREINYSYKDEEINTNKKVVTQAFWKGYNNNYIAGTFDSVVDIVRNNNGIIYSKRISQISSSNFKIDFNSKTQRLYDNRGFNIDEILVSNNNGNLINKFELKYEEYESDGINNLTNNSLKKEYSRTILKELREYNIENNTYESHFFDYNLKGFGGTINQTLPHTSSFASDQWGYYNGAINNKYFVPKIFVYPDIGAPSHKRFRLERLTNYSGREFIFDGADRSPQSTYMKNGVLKKIKYPTGGYTLYDFEPNEYLELGQKFLGPGLRIKKIISNDGIKDSEKHYNYNDKYGKTSGKIVSKPIMYDIISDAAHDSNNYDYYENNLIRYSNSQAEINSTDNRKIGYSEVTISYPGNGKAVYKYSNYATIEDPDDIFVDDDDSGSCTFNYPLGYCDGFFYRTKIFGINYGSFKNTTGIFQNYPPLTGTSPFPPEPNYDWNRGHLLAKEYYNENNQLLKKVNYVYKNYTPLPTSNGKPHVIYGLKVKMLNVSGTSTSNNIFKDGTHIRAAKYRILTDIVKVLTEKIETNYYPDTTLSPLINKHYTYYESPSHPFITMEKYNNSNGEEVIKRYYYPPDLFTTSNLAQRSLMYEMTSRNQINKPVKIITLNNNNITSTSNIHYGYTTGVNNYNLILPKAIFMKKGGESIENSDRILTYDSYDKLGNLTQYTTEKGIPISLIWGYNSNYVVAKLESVKFSDIILSENDWRDINEELRNPDIIDNLRLTFSKAKITSYTYIPLLGVISITNPNGLKTFFNYDGKGQLKNIKDYKNSTLNEFKYNYKD